MISKTAAVFGSLLILVGLFLPMLAGPPELETKSFFTWGGPLDGLLVLALALAGLAIGLAGRIRWGIAIAAATLFFVYLAVADFHEIHEMSGSLPDQSMDGITLAVGPWVMVAGSLLMVMAAGLSLVSPAKPAKKTSG
jgi:hypothetical protein